MLRNITTEDFERFYAALIKRDSSYVGIFYVGVKTTSVFCIATCRARKPKKENVEFYRSFKAALANGYRPCKICKPTENSNAAPSQVLFAIQMVKDNPKAKVSDQLLRDHNVSPEYVRRWFKKNYNITFHAYQRMYRINNAYKELKDGKKSTYVAYDQGYESLSGFNYTFKKLIGKSPKKGDHKNVILLHRITTPLGSMFLGATDRGICLLEFTDRKMLETEFRDLQRLLNAQIFIGENIFIKQAKKELQEYFEGIRQGFDVSLDHPGTDFQQTAWNALLNIPYGQTVSYQEQAKLIKNSKAVRAVARANGMNRISIIIPCHRIIGKDGNLTGYGGGLERKRWLLDFEKSNSS